jgi:uncharacterized protein (TIGR02271 family)
MTRRNITAVFDSRAQAQRAEQQLLQLGIPREHINIIDKSSREYSAAAAEGTQKGVWQTIKEMFMPDEDGATYEESIRRGGFMVIAAVDDTRSDQAIRILEEAGAVDLERRQEEWRATGWTGPQLARVESTGAASGRAQTERAARKATDEEAIPIVEERLRVGKREVNRGSVRVRSFVVEEPVREEVRLREERVDIERRPVNQPTQPLAAGTPGDLLKERTVELTETAEEAVVAKDAIVKEEVRMRKRADERVEQIDETVRHTEVEVEDTRAPLGESKRRDSGKDASRRH